jgi:hypothetical protein
MLAACAPHQVPQSIELAESVRAARAVPTIPDVTGSQAEVPCQGEPDVLVEGGLMAEPLPPEIAVAGGIKALPLADPEPVPEHRVRGRMKAPPNPPPQRENG